ncbi:MAG: hypothetical protein JXR70_01265 [Spirochaetales bacterium]|nr:hypothetical protein [Spirochaetales bacterium]
MKNLVARAPIPNAKIQMSLKQHMIAVEKFKAMAMEGSAKSIDFLISCLDKNTDLPTTKRLDYALSFVTSQEGIGQLEHYLFNGTQIQRNYITLFFARRNEWPLVNRAYAMKLIDYRQAYSR